MIDVTDNISTSGFVPSSEYVVSGQFSNFLELSSRGYCRLYKAQRNGQWFTLKTLKSEVANDPMYQGMLDKEFNLMMQLNHPNVVRVYSREEIPNFGPCIVMEYIDGRTLGDFLSEKPTQSVRESVARQLLEAIGYCHGKQIIHRDLKPSNVLVTYNGNRVKLIDFGLSDSDRYAVLKEPAYTKAYAAPEQLSGGEVDNRADLYAFGLILKQLFPNLYGHVVCKCLQPRREKRYASAEEVAAAMRSCERGRKWLPITVIIILLVLGLVVYLIQSLYQEENFVQKEYVQEESGKDLTIDDSLGDLKTQEITFQEHNNHKTDAFPAQQSTAFGYAEEAESLLDHYCYNLKFEFDSIIKPFDEEVNAGTILYREQFHNHKMIALLQMSVHIQQRRQQLPKSVQTAFKSYAGDLWNRYSAKYPYTDEKGKEIYPYYYDLHKEHLISDEEYEKLSDEYERNASEIRILSAQLGLETAKE